MSKPLEMSKVTLFALQKERSSLLSEIQSLGVLQPVEIKRDAVEELEKPKQITSIKEVADTLIGVSRMVRILKLAPRKTDMVQNVLGLELLDKRKVERKNDAEVIKGAQTFLEAHETSLITLEIEYTTLVEEEDELNTHKQVIEQLSALGVPLSELADTDKLGILIARVPVEQAAVLRTALESKKTVAFEMNALSKKEYIVTLISLQRLLLDSTTLLKQQGASILSLPTWALKEHPGRYIKSQLTEVSDKKKAVIERIAKHAKSLFEDAVIFREELEIVKNRLETVHKMLDSSSFFVMQGWIATKDANHFEEKITKKIDAVSVLVEEPSKDDVVPVALQNRKSLKPFEMLTELYALPKYGDLDPTFIVGPLFLIFAAFMLTDAVYGLGLVLLGAIILKKFAKYDEGLKQIGIIIAGMGSLTVLFGVLTGSYFGDLPKYFFGVSSEQLAFWKDPLADPLYFLILSISVAILYLNIGFVLGMMEDLRKKDYKTMVKDRILWFLLQIGIALLVLKFNPPLLFGVGLATLIIAAAVIGIVVMHGPLGLLGISGLMGDMISFSRLFALSLSTAGIALAVNLLANLVSEVPYVGLLLAVLIFLIGHAFGFVMNSIGSFVHALRLQFVEFFGRFYEGGGDKFSPLKEERFYSEVEE
ncbi:MAG: V-type ATP synthase subunit I [Nanoarchaeota archaeon]|nr:V-type ATP synthase subunit I [Nanoarchaeota archaeon]